jgi:hypothetical protein
MTFLQSYSAIFCTIGGGLSGASKTHFTGGPGGPGHDHDYCLLHHATSRAQVASCLHSHEMLCLLSKCMSLVWFRAILINIVFSLTVGSAEGSIKDLFAKVTTINAKHGPFDLVLCTGDFFGQPGTVAERGAIDMKGLLDGTLAGLYFMLLWLGCSYMRF